MSRKTDPFAIDLTPGPDRPRLSRRHLPDGRGRDLAGRLLGQPASAGASCRSIHSTSQRAFARPCDRITFQVRVDTDFPAVIEGCATAGTDRESTWINPTLRDLYGQLFKRGICHTVEVWDGDRLVGGLYGLSLGAVFFGELMFHRATDASKIALAHLVDRLRAGGYALCDTQFVTDHLRTFGGIEISREDYDERLADGLARTADFFALDRSA